MRELLAMSYISKSLASGHRFFSFHFCIVPEFLMCAGSVILFERTAIPWYQWNADCQRSIMKPETWAQTQGLPGSLTHQVILRSEARAHDRSSLHSNPFPDQNDYLLVFISTSNSSLKDRFVDHHAHECSRIFYVAYCTSNNISRFSALTCVREPWIVKKPVMEYKLLMI